MTSSTYGDPRTLFGQVEQTPIAGYYYAIPTGLDYRALATTSGLGRYRHMPTPFSGTSVTSIITRSVADNSIYLSSPTLARIPPGSSRAY